LSIISDMPQDKNNIHQANRQIARAAGTVMVAYILSNLAGLLAKTLTARAFGTGADSEAFLCCQSFLRGPVQFGSWWCTGISLYPYFHQVSR